MNAANAINFEDLRLLAKRKLPRIAFDFIDGGVDDEDCLKRNREAFQRHQLVPRYLVDVSLRDQSTQLLGQRYASPFGIAPTGLAGLFYPRADELLATAAKAANVPFLLSSVGNASIEQIAKIAPDNVWFQLYCTRDDSINKDLIKRVRDVGVRTLVISIDVPVNPNRERNRRNGFTRPFRMTPSIVLESLGHPAWVMRYLWTGGIPMMRTWTPYGKKGASASEVADLYGTLTPAPKTTWQTLEQIRSDWKGVLVIKGILHPEDAVRAVGMGADGLILSNHGGRQLDFAPAPIEMLPEIRAAVGDKIELMVDSGIRRGSDVVIARCLGARHVFFGRPTLFAAAAGGAEGIARALQIMRNEVDMVMAQIGCRSFDELGAQHLRAMK